MVPLDVVGVRETNPSVNGLAQFSVFQVMRHSFKITFGAYRHFILDKPMTRTTALSLRSQGGHKILSSVGYTMAPNTKIGNALGNSGLGCSPSHFLLFVLQIPFLFFLYGKSFRCTLSLSFYDVFMVYLKAKLRGWPATKLVHAHASARDVSVVLS
jgi:hypothetical protein